jgi:preprotein translocase subunit SecA
MIDSINKEVISVLMKGQIPIQDPSQVQQARGPRRLDMSEFEQTKSDAQSAYEGQEGEGQQAPQQRKVEPVRTGRKIGRNEIVKVRYQNGKIVEAKYKKVELDINSGACVLTS